MVQFAHKRLQVFVSSTFTDLVKERQAAVEAILTAGHIPAGMELFTAGDESQMDVIKQWIDESDIYLLILGGRYGSIEPTTGKSYTHLEYEYALAQNKPLFACIINDEALETKVRNIGSEVLEKNNPNKLTGFKELVLTKMVKFWEDPKDIKIAVGETLAYLARKEELGGWVRSDSEADMPALLDEITRLSKENSILRAGLQKNEGSILGLHFEGLLELLVKKGLLPIFENIDQLTKISTYGATPKSKGESLSFVELKRIGLFKENGLNHYILTNEGRHFINRYELYRIQKV